jgi:type IV pilus assembly protein PilX
MKQIRQSQIGLPKQRGAALIMGLLVLVIMILLTLTATSSTLMQNRMAGNFRDSSLAFQASEGASRWAMMWLLSLDDLNRPFPCAETVCSATDVWLGGRQNPGHPDEISHDYSEWTSALSYGYNPTDNSAVSPAQSIPIVPVQPQFLIEQIYFDRDDLAGPPQLGVAYYRVASLGHSVTDKNHAVLSAVLGKRYQ